MVHAATHENIPDLVEMMQEFYDESAFSLDRDAAVSSFKTLLDEPAFGAIWMCFDGKDATGYVVLTICFSMEYGGFEGCVDDLYVRPAARRKGVGNRLLESLLIECHDRNLESLQVEVAPYNGAAKALYEKIGLQIRQDDRDVMVATFKTTF